MLDNSQDPSLLEDTNVEVNPYEITENIWSLVADYFIRKYNVQYTDAYPLAPVERPTIVGLINRRTPGRDGSKIHGKGHNFTKFIKKTEDGYIHEAHVQQQELILEYIVVGISSAETKRIAWDLERAILEVAGVLQKEIEGFQLYFKEQIQDSSLIQRQQDELIKRTIRFQVLLPIKFVKVVPELRFIEKNIYLGNLPVSGQLYIRSSDSKVFDIPVASGRKIANINNVYLKSSNYPYEWEPLVSNVDFYIKKTTSGLYIEWNNFGRIPSIGDEFRVDYELYQTIDNSKIIVS